MTMLANPSTSPNFDNPGNGPREITDTDEFPDFYLVCNENGEVVVVADVKPVPIGDSR